ncbi:CpsD/CapB family tyrosine-protein kinase [Jeongeupia naejangsanensis]|uniref:Chain length determinant protein tyrosine kinase EpsG n=1 Tax=Jeongeupia naejangsanensis TaxID=613195 RepID=A0ABS2BJH0_9NEIS|nr:CpsD/CapB family tyrosine-protein kinase [Jeongeupia naejangsanensis]MBM3115146.1 chain length determinant protein tyrosine kinase EpsG [Jeongeupia naejangsanensis]
MNQAVRLPLPTDKGVQGGLIGQILLAQHKIGIADLPLIAECQREHGLRFGEAAIRLGMVGSDDIQTALSEQFDFPVLGASAGVDRQVVCAYDPYSPQAEAVRGARTQLLLHWLDGTRKQVAIVPADDDGSHGEAFAANLAVALAQLSQQVLLIDANLRRPTQHALFDVAPGQGLADCLAARASWHEVIRTVDGIDNLQLLQGGTIAPNPQELLSKPAFAELLHQAGERYDAVIVVSAAPAQASDMHLVATRARGVVLVAKRNHTRLKPLLNTKAQLQAAGVHLIGAVLHD